MRLLALAAVALSGCAGITADSRSTRTPVAAVMAISGGPWAVEDLDGGGIPDGARLDISFEPGDAGTSRVTGHGGCNRFSGRWAQVGHDITIGPLVATRMACPQPLMEAETKYLKALDAAKTVAFDGDGALRLIGSAGTVKLRKAKA